LNRPVMTVITINKVQDVYDTPVYHTVASEEEECLQYMNKCMREGKELDVEGYYRRKGFRSVHIGEFKLKKESEEVKGKIAVVMPVYNETKYLKEAIESILE
jgi:hypothetical protein